MANVQGSKFTNDAKTAKDHARQSHRTCSYLELSSEGHDGYAPGIAEMRRSSPLKPYAYLGSCLKNSKVLLRINLTTNPSFLETEVLPLHLSQSHKNNLPLVRASGFPKDLSQSEWVLPKRVLRSFVRVWFTACPFGYSPFECLCSETVRTYLFE